MFYRLRLARVLVLRGPCHANRQGGVTRPLNGSGLAPAASLRRFSISRLRGWFSPYSMMRTDAVALQRDQGGRQCDVNVNDAK